MKTTPRKPTKPKCLGQIACEAFNVGWTDPWKNQTAYAKRQWKDAAQAVLDAFYCRVNSEMQKGKK